MYLGMQVNERGYLLNIDEDGIGWFDSLLTAKQNKVNIRYLITQLPTCSR